MNVHGTGLVLCDRGVLIRGASGTGKTALALFLLQMPPPSGFARLVADDQLLLSASAGRLLMAAPPAIAGLVEMRGAMPQPVAHLGSAVVDLVVTLVRPGEEPRLAEPANIEISGVSVRELVLASRDPQGARAALFAAFGWAPFG